MSLRTARATDPATSQAPSPDQLTNVQAKVLARFRRSPKGCTADDVMRSLSQFCPSTVARRVTELEALGLIEATGETKPTRTSRPARVLKVAS